MLTQLPVTHTLSDGASIPGSMIIPGVVSNYYPADYRVSTRIRHRGTFSYSADLSSESQRSVITTYSVT